MLRLIAHSREDGWAFVHTLEGVRLVRPPYTQAYMPLVDDRAVEAALLQPGFAATDQQFDNWHTLIEHLNQEVACSRQGSPMLSGSVLGEAVLEFAPPDVLVNFLKRVEDELLPAREWQHAEALLSGVLKSPAARSVPEIVLQVARLMEKTSALKRKVESERCEFVTSGMDWSTMYPQAVARYGRGPFTQYVRDVSGCPSIFRFE